MNGLNFTTTGFADLERRLKLLATTEATRAGQTANRAASAYMAKKVKANAPDGPSSEGEIRNRKRKSGAVVQEKHNKIKNHVKVRKGRNADATKVENIVAINAYHAPMEEFGSVHNAPTHFMEITFDQESQNALDVMGKSLNKTLTRLGV
jgi:HK97 gp10 family phage protein